MRKVINNPAWSHFKILVDQHGQAALARLMGVRYQEINDILHRRRRMNDKVLDFLGFERVELIQSKVKKKNPRG